MVERHCGQVWQRRTRQQGQCGSRSSGTRFDSAFPYGIPLSDLQLERTFLAWLRTSLAFASIGIAITQLFRLNTTIEEREGRLPVAGVQKYRLREVGKPLGATFLGIAIVVLLVGGRRYFESQVWSNVPFLKRSWGKSMH